MKFKLCMEKLDLDHWNKWGSIERLAHASGGLAGCLCIRRRKIICADTDAAVFAHSERDSAAVLIRDRIED